MNLDYNQKRHSYAFCTCIRYLCILSFFVALFLFPSSSYAQNYSNILDAKLIKHSDYYEFSMSLDDKVSYKTFTLENPSRLVVDLNEVNVNSISKANIGQLKIDNFIKKVRKGKFNNNARIVFDLKSKCKIIKNYIATPSSTAHEHKLIIQFLPSIKKLPKAPDGLDIASQDILADLAGTHLDNQDTETASKSQIHDVSQKNKLIAKSGEELSIDSLIAGNYDNVAIDIDIDNVSLNNDVLADQPDMESTMSDIIADIITENVGYEMSEDGIRLEKGTRMNFDTTEGVYYEISPYAIPDSGNMIPVFKKDALEIILAHKVDGIIKPKLRPNLASPKIKTASEVVKKDVSLVRKTSIEAIISVKLKPQFVVIRKRPQIAQRKAKSKPIIVIDAGHGGKDPGAVSRKGTREKDLTLKYAKSLKSVLERSGKYKVYMTRNKDVFISLSGRVRRARRYKGDLFISIHADSAESRKAQGLSVYTLSERASDKEAGRLARRENKVDIVAGANFKNQQRETLMTLIDLSQRETMNSSTHYASTLLKELSVRHASMKQDALRHAGFTVLSAPDIPSILLEIGYLSNRREEKAMKTTAYRNKIVRSLVVSIDKFFDNRKVYY